MAASASDNAVDPVEQLLDLILYAPIGLVAKGVDSFPDLAKRGRANAANARVIGQFALGATNTKARSAIADAEQHIAAFLAIVAESASPKRSSSRDAGETTTPPAEPVRVTVDELAVEELIGGYDAMTAAQILPLLSKLDHAQRDQIERYERSHRARKTVLNRLRQLQG
jgi:hypothetical protein